jgi:ferrous iron transport protein B
MKNKKILVALAGNPNSGKSTIFNNLTGSNQHVGNYPGVTVEKKEGKLKFKGYEITVVDLPGTYSLSAKSEDELVAKNFILNEKPDIIINILDASNLERNLYLYTQLAELETPIILSMNMTDIVNDKGLEIDYSNLSKLLGVPVVECIGNKKFGMDNLLNTIIDLYEKKIEIKQTNIHYGEDIEKEFKKIHDLLIKNEYKIKNYSINWIILGLFEGDVEIIDLIKNIDNKNQSDIFEKLNKSIAHLKNHFGEDIDVIIADKRYGFVNGVYKQSVKKIENNKIDISDKIDRIVLNRFLGLPIFALVMYMIFKFTFAFSTPIVGIFESVFEWLSNIFTSIIPEGLLQSFIVDGLIGGVGGILGFFPLVLFMFFAIAFFEDSGYMARAAFVMDRIMHKFGLHGKAFLPMMLSTNGCAVPGLMATRTLDNKNDRLITMMVTPFMICGAKLPIFALFIGAFFAPKYGANIMFIMYALSITIAFLSAWILKKFVLKGENSFFVMELPPYHIPTLKGILLKMWERGFSYIKKATGILLLISIVMWFGLTFPKVAKTNIINEETFATQKLEKSFIGKLGNFIEPVIKPIGFGWKEGVALIAGIAAKEVVVSTLGTLYSLGDVDPENAQPLKDALQKDKNWNPLKAIVFLIFCLIYLPCFVAMSVFYKESGSSIKWTSFLIFWTTIMAWGASFIVYRIGLLLGFGG